MKLGKLITGFVLSTLLAVGVGVGIGSNRNETRSAEAANTDPNQYVRIYFSGLESWGDVNLNPSFKVGASGTVYTSVLSASGTPTLDAIFNSNNGKYVCDLPISSTQTNNIYNYFQSGNKTWWHPNDGDNYWSDNTKIYHSFKQAYIVQIALTNTDHNYTDWTQAWFNYTPSDLGYFVHYDYNGGIAASGTKSNQEATGSWTTQAAPSKSGYNFAGWKRSDSSAVVGAGVSQTKPSSPITLTAQWTAVPADTYTITYNTNGGSGSAPESQTPAVGSEVTFRTYSGTKTGYTFTGWNTNDSGTGTHYDAGGTGTPTIAKDGTLALYAEWTAKTTTVTLNRQGATTGSTSVIATYGSAMPSITLPTRTGYTFGGYFTSTGGSGTKYYNADGSSAKNWDITDSTKTLYAYWTAQTSTVTLNQQSGTGGTSSVTATYGSAMPSITLPTRAGYTFGGYWTETGGTGTKYYNADGSSARNWDLTGAQTLYAQWTGYFVSINGGSYESMTLNTENPNEYYIQVTVNAGDTLTFKKNDSAYSFTPKDVTNNNYNAAGFLFGGTFNIYLDISNSTVWSAGISTTVGYYLMVDGNIIGSALATNPNNPNEVYLTQHQFEEGQNINIFHVAQGVDIYYEYKNPDLNSGSAAGCFEDTGVDLTCLKTDFYDMYYNFSTNSDYFGISAATYCNAYAVAFNSAIRTICEGIVGGTKSIADLKAAWKTQYDNWVQMGKDNIYAQGIMTDYDKTLSDNIGLCVAKYDYIVGKYGDALAGTGYTANFMNRTITPSGRIALIKNIMDPKTAGTVTIVVISSIVAIGAFAGYFFYKKKKED